MASSAAQAGAAPAAPVEEVLITGSLISGTAAVGVPVTNLGADDFQEVAPLSVYQIVQTLPSIEARMSDSPSVGGTRHFQGNISIHGQDSVEQLLMIDGKRYPLQGYDLDNIDPSFIPQLAVQRIDVLTAGASATYGADAIAGVINVILRRGYDGAQSYVRGSIAQKGGAPSITASQLWGRTWDTGNITLTFEFTRTNRVEGGALPWYTTDFREMGLHDRRRLSSSIPGIVTTGAPAAPAGVTVPVGFSPQFGDMFCGNCFSLPDGVGWDFGTQDPGPTTTWATLQGNAGVKNLRNPWDDGYIRPEKENISLVATFDQELLDDFFGLGPVALRVDAFWANRRGKQVFPPDLGQSRDLWTPAAGATVPTNNPYRPTGAPAVIRIHRSLSLENEVIITGGDISKRYLFGLNFDEMPFGWHGSLGWAVTEDHSYGHDLNAISPNHFRAALGQTIASVAPTSGLPGMAAYIKPATVPYLNVFCDSRQFQCNSPATLAYLRGNRVQNVWSKLNQFDAQIDGPIFELPGGPIQVALAAQRLTRSQIYRQEQTDMSHTTSIISLLEDKLYESFNAAIAQINIPVFGGDFSFPFAQSFDIEAGYRYDKYSNLAEGVWTPKIAANWMIGWGLQLRGSWGKAFRTPKSNENLPVFSNVTAANILGGDVNATDSFLLNCASVQGSPSGVAIPGSLTAELNPTCSTAQALRAPGAINVSGAAAGAADILLAYPDFPGEANPLGPQRTVQYNYGFHFAPTDEHFGGFLTGLVLDMTVFKLKYSDIIQGGGVGDGPNDPRSRDQYIVAPCPNLPNSDPCNAAFRQLVADVSSVVTRNQRAPAPQFWDNIKVIEAGFTTNQGISEFSGIDFDARWDFDIANYGTFHVGASGYYELNQRSQDAPGEPWNESYEGERHSGARLQRVRYRAGWTDGTWNVVTFFNYRGHGPLNNIGILMTPPCFYATGFGPGSCFPGSQYFGPYDEGFMNHFTPATVLVDLSLGYNTGDMFTNTYLHNINISFTITNLLDKDPPWGPNAEASQLRNIQAFNQSYSDLTRQFSLAITKTW
jgi:outer membrane receptor protein involved in Fe transport